ncbi:hypothetical protein BIV57_10105 [Mangrovactinospora gilvigrisea]|uniref:Polyketide cyclase n=1 Tax=Mangrovactinospora gilvigrisea TaxID=1428644 RepID=A0A1J7C7U6_9ACTN|nr:SRPBCC family protein [Mangrovactinospora gilvigrisea]OIV37604.1 hypothetical protein BIV57_10105 [Mangrovactinospora gilvigrisea]
MPIYSTTRDLPLAPEQVYDFLADPRNLRLWSSGVEEVDDPLDAEGIAGVTPELGRRYRYRFPGRHRRHTLTCHFLRPPSLVAFRGQRMWTPLGCQTPTFLFHVRPAPGGSTVMAQVRLQLGGAMLLTWPLVALGWRRDLPDDMVKLYDLLAPLAVPVEDPEAARAAAVEEGATALQLTDSARAFDPSAPGVASGTAFA